MTTLVSILVGLSIVGFVAMAAFAARNLSYDDWSEFENKLSQYDDEAVTLALYHLAAGDKTTTPTLKDEINNALQHLSVSDVFRYAGVETPFEAILGTDNGRYSQQVADVISLVNTVAAQYDGDVVEFLTTWGVLPLNGKTSPTAHKDMQNALAKHTSALNTYANLPV